MSYFDFVKASCAVLFFCVFLVSSFAETGLQGIQTDAFPSTLPEAQQFLDRFTPRREGSVEEKAVVAALKQRLTALGFQVDQQNYQDINDAHSFSTSLSLSIKGKNPDRLVVVTPINGYGDRTNNAGLAWVENWVESFRGRQPDLSLTILFMGAEREGGRNGALGSRQFLEDFFPSEPTVVLYVDCAVFSSKLEVVIDSGAYISPLWLTQSLLQDFRDSGFQTHLRGTHPLIFRFDIPEKRTLAHPWFLRDFPVLLVQTKEGEVGDSQPPATNRFGQTLDSFIHEYSKGIPPFWDQHFLYFEFFGLSFFLPQEIYLVLLLGILGVFLFIFLIFSPSLRDDLTSVSRSLWQLPVYYFFLFLFFALSTVFINALLGLREFATFWQYNPLAVLALKVTLCLGLYIVSFLQIRRMPLSRWPGFYSYSAVLVLGLEVLVGASMELSFSFYFLWALVFAGLFHASSKRWLKLAFFALAPVWFVKAALDVFWLSPDQTLIRLAVVSTLGGNLMITTILFPFLLMTNSFHYLRHQRQERNEQHRAQLSLLLWTCISAALAIFLLRFNPFQNNPIPLEILENLNLEKSQRSAVIQSPVPWQTMDVKVGRETWALAAGLGSQKRSLPFKNEVWKTTVLRESFLDRYIWRLNFQAKSRLEGVTFQLESDKSLVVYGCNFPFQLTPSGLKATIFVGKNPPQNLELVLTLAANVRASLSVDARFAEFPFLTTLSSTEFVPRPSLDVTDRVLLTP